MPETSQTPLLPFDYPLPSKDSNKPWSHKGRFGRLSYLAWVLIVVIVFKAAFLIVGTLFGHFNATAIIEQGAVAGRFFPSVISVTLYIAQFYIFIIFCIRRLHDVNRSGWWLLLALIPMTLMPIIIGFLFFLYLLFARGTDGVNHFGSQRQTPQWEKVVGWINIVLIPVMFVIDIFMMIAVPPY